MGSWPARREAVASSRSPLRRRHSYSRCCGRLDVEPGNRMVSPEVMGRTLAEAPDPQLARVALFRRRAMFRLAARDLTGAPVEEVVAENSAIAEACLSLACRSVVLEGLAVVG